MKKTRFLLALVLSVAAASCGGDNAPKDGGGGGSGGLGGLGGSPSDAGMPVDKADSSTDLPVQETGALFTIGGTITGLTGSGLILRNDGADDLVIPAGATTFTFTTSLPVGQSYAVTIAAQPSTPAQTCAVAASTGVVGAADVTTVAITCATSAFTIGGTITGLTGTGLVLQNNAGDDLTVPPGATTFTFATAVADGTPYAVTVLTQPSSPAQVCAVDSGTGTVNAVGITNVAITCVAKTFTVGGTITGLTGTGLVLQNNAGDNLTVATGATSFTFPTQISVGGAYAITVLVQPSGPAQTCTVGAGTGTLTTDVSNVTVTCSTKVFSVGGTITGLTGTGMVLRNNGGDNLPVGAGGTSFTFPTTLPSGSAFAVTVFTQPSSPAQNCVVSGGTGTIGTAAVTSVVINCTVDKFTIGGQITGLRGPVILQNNSENQTVTADGMFAFPTPISGGATYAVTVATQPTSPSQTCVVTNGSGTVSGANVTNIMIACATNAFHVQAVVSGFTGNGLVIRNNTEPVLVHMNGTVPFPSTVPSGAGYSVTVAIQPNMPTQTCIVGANAAGVVGAGDVTVPITCMTNVYNVRVTVTGLAGAGLILQSGADSVPVTASSTFNMPTKMLSGTSYQVTVAQQPSVPTQTCVVAPATSAIVGGADAQVTVTCTTNAYRITGMITGLVGSGLVLENNLTNDTPAIGAGATMFMFSSPILSNAMYGVTVKTQPTGPNQTCVPSSNMGLVGAGDVTMVLITCTTNLYTVSASITGLTGSGLVLQDNGGDSLPVAATANNTTVPFATRLTSIQTYAVTVLTQPSSPTEVCTVVPPMGAVGNDNVTVAVNCAIPHSIGGTVTGLVASGLVLRDNGTDDLSVAVATPQTFRFATQLAQGGMYAVSVAASPPNQSCQVTANASGPVGATDITNVGVNCAICATATEGNRAIVTCPTGQTIASFDFVSFGTPTGTCGSFAFGMCNWPMSDASLSSCIGQPFCNVLAARGTFGGDPCSGIDKSVAIQARCQ